MRRPKCDPVHGLERRNPAQCRPHHGVRFTSAPRRGEEDTRLHRLSPGRRPPRRIHRGPRLRVQLPLGSVRLCGGREPNPGRGRASTRHPGHHRRAVRHHPARFCPAPHHRRRLAGPRRRNPATDPGHQTRFSIPTRGRTGHTHRPHTRTHVLTGRRCRRRPRVFRRGCTRRPPEPAPTEPDRPSRRRVLSHLAARTARPPQNRRWHPPPVADDLHHARGQAVVDLGR